MRTLLGAAFRHLFWSSRVAEIELTFAQAQMLNYVARHPGCAMGDVARHFGVTLPNVTQLVDRLQHKGFLSRGSDPADRRVCTLTLTAEGRGLVAELERLRAGRLESVLARMTVRDRARVLKGLEALVEAALRAGAESDDPGTGQSPRYRSSPR
ncbi:MAG TPA: MarR family transcriptional regulator [Thermodesulfobacteriota bacterium]